MPLPDVLRDRYVLERELGRGGMATVYLARDLKHGRLVALKFLRPELANALGPERFLREIEIAATLSHPNILPFYDSGTVELLPGSPGLYYAMPYVEGESLRSRLERERQLPVADVLRIARDLASALAYAHERGVVHRDLKPENVLLSGSPPRPGKTGDWHVLLVDFGIAKALNAAGVERLTETGLALGTPAYMSPEQASGERHLDCRSDLYALGCMVYELLAGQPPFTGPTAQSIAARHAVDPVPSLRTVRPTVSEPVERAIERALAKVPADRFNTVVEFADALTAKTTPASPRPRSHLLSRSRLLLGTTIFSVAIVAVAGAIRWRASARLAVVPSAAKIAVLPFGSIGNDTALIRLGRDLAVTLSASLDQLGGIETADRLAVASGTAHRATILPEEGAALARRLGAGSFVRGTLVSAGEMVRLDASLYQTRDGVPMARPITVMAPRDSIGALTDSVAWRLLRDIWQKGNPPTPSLEAVTTRLLPALRAFLDGERNLAENRWNEASLAFRAAISADSTFVLAHYRYYATEAWMLREVEPRILDVVRRNLTRLPERDRLLVTVHLNDARVTPMIEGMREATERYPDYWPAWLLYGDVLVHNGPMVGHDWTEALSALHRAVALSPDLVPAWEHIDMVTYGRDEPENSRAVARLEELGWEGARDPFYALENAVVRAGGTIPPGSAALADSLAAEMVSDPDPQALERSNGAFRLLRGGRPAAQIQLNQRALRVPQTSPQARTALRAANSWAWAARGRWDSALAGLGEVASERPGVLGPERYLPPRFQPIGGPVLAIESYGLAVLGAWLGASDPRTADERRPAAVAVVGQLSHPENRKDARGRIAWLDGLLGLARQDRSAIRRARADAGRSGYVQTALVDRSLAAFELAVAGDRRRAGSELAALEEHCAEYRNCNDITPSIAVQRFAAAQWLAEAGEVERARRLLRWQDAVALSGWLFALQQTLVAPTFLLRARLEEQTGDRARATEYYRQFLERYDQPMPAQQHLVDEVKAALARLAGRGEGESSPY